MFFSLPDRPSEPEFSPKKARKAKSQSRRTPCVSLRRLLKTNDQRQTTNHQPPTTNDPPRNDYNSRVNASAQPKPKTDNQQQDNTHEHRHPIYAAEATGLLVIAVLLLVLTIIRYWRYIPWSVR
jgi:hypothetical protein